MTTVAMLSLLNQFNHVEAVYKTDPRQPYTSSSEPEFLEMLILSGAENCSLLRKRRQLQETPKKFQVAAF